MNISMDKKYTMDGEPYVVLTVTKPGKCPVAGYFSDGSLMSFMADGTSHYGAALVEVNPYADFVIDEKVMVRDDGYVDWEKCHFSGLSVNGKPMTFLGGSTSFSNEGCEPTHWDQCRRPTAEELAE